jgi:hypothetical protein
MAISTANAPVIRRAMGSSSTDRRNSKLPDLACFRHVVPEIFNSSRARGGKSGGTGRIRSSAYMRRFEPSLREARKVSAMSKPIVISIPHSLGKEEALRRLKPGLTGAAASFPVLKVDEEIWSGDRLTFRVRALGQAAAGTVDVADDHVRLEVTLPWLLQKFAQVAQATIRARGNLLLEKK